MTVRYFDPKDFEIIFQGVVVGDFAQDFVEAKFTRPLYRLVRGVDGDTTRVRTGNRSGTIKVSLLQSSPSNNTFSNFVLVDELSGFTNLGPLLCRDKVGGTLMLATACFIENIPPISFGITAKVRTWTFVCDNLIMYLGGLPMSGEVLLAPSSPIQTEPVDTGIVVEVPFSQV